MTKEEKTIKELRDASSLAHLGAMFQDVAKGINDLADSRLLTTAEAAQIKEYRLHIESITRTAQARTGLTPD